MLSTTVFIALTRKQTLIKIMSTTNKSFYVYFTPKNVRHDEKVSISLFIHLWNAVSKNTSPRYQFPSVYVLQRDLDAASALRGGGGGRGLLAIYTLRSVARWGRFFTTGWTALNFQQSY